MRITPEAMDLYEEFINHKEMLNSAEYAFCLRINPEETKSYLIEIECDPTTWNRRWININIEKDKKEYDLRKEQGL